MIAHAMRAILFASATATSLKDPYRRSGDMPRRVGDEKSDYFGNVLALAGCAACNGNLTLRPDNGDRSFGLVSQRGIGLNVGFGFAGADSVDTDMVAGKFQRQLLDNGDLCSLRRGICRRTGRGECARTVD